MHAACSIPGQAGDHLRVCAVRGRREGARARRLHRNGVAAHVQKARPPAGAGRLFPLSAAKKSQAWAATVTGDPISGPRDEAAPHPPSGWARAKRAVLGAPRSPHDRGVFHQLALVAFFAWVGLGADGLSSTCYGPAEAFHALGAHPHLSIFVALATAITILVLSASEAQVM
jgi:hypothetical protein